MPQSHSCLTCLGTFLTVAELVFHCNILCHTPNPFICVACNLSFSSLQELSLHMNSALHTNRFFLNPSSFLDGRDTNAASLFDRPDISEIDLDGKDEGNLGRSGPDVGLTTPLFCNQCSRGFTTEKALNEHLKHSSKHKELREKKCPVCSRRFKSKADLAQHHMSLAHQKSDLKCPLSSCEKEFKAPSAIAHHVESGCHGITRHQVTAAVHRMKIPDISIKQITGPPISSSTAFQTQTYIATAASFNSVTLKFDCSMCSKSFQTLSSLNAHLNSAAHDDAEFKCPKCKTDFTLISGLVQHVESKTCSLKRASIESSTAVDIHSLPMRFSRLLTI